MTHVHRPLFGLREQLGVVFRDLPGLLPKLLTPASWIAIGNRHDALVPEADGPGIRCEGDWSSDLHACDVFPVLGSWLMSRALNQWPIRLAESAPAPSSPEVSFVIPHRGRERIELLRLVIASILAQRDARVECIVVEQSPTREVYDLPNGVRYLHLNHELDPQPWRKSWAFNVGVQMARGNIVVCHDGDILVPERYSAEIQSQMQGGRFQVVHLQRFLFYVDQAATADFAARGTVVPVRCERVNQNWQGGTLAITKSAYDAIGGFDERFVDWGGEDNEFFDRCTTLRQNTFGYLPFVHLWHAPQPTKFNAAREHALSVMRERMAMPHAQRAAELKSAREMTALESVHA
jgi:hypothetical protein